MPGSILINEGRRSASPDRRVTFGNIERYDIMTSNELKANGYTRGSSKDNLSTINGNYPMTRLDNRIRKAIVLGFTNMTGDSVGYEEIVDFLLEFNVIVNTKLCNERQITAIIQSSFPKCIVKPSAKHSLVFLNIENRSDEVVKEELVRVTTEPIVNPLSDAASIEAQKWIKEEPEDFESDEENEELTLIQKNKEEIDKKSDASSAENSPLIPSKVVSSTQFAMKPNKDEIAAAAPSVNIHTNGNHANSRELSAAMRDFIAANNHESASILANKAQGGGIRSPPPQTDVTDFPETNYVERAIDVPDHAPSHLEMDKPRISISKDDAHVTLNRTCSFSNKTMGSKSRSVTDMAKKFELTANENKSANLQRKRSFTKSTDKTFVGSIRDRFRSKKQNEEDSPNNEKKDKKEDLKKGKKNKKDEEKKNSTILPIRRSTTKSTENTNTSSEPRASFRASSNKKTQNSLSVSCLDVRDSFRSKQNSSGFSRNASTSVTDVRSSFRENTEAKANLTRSVVERSKVDNNKDSQSPNLRRAAVNRKQQDPTRASLRKNEKTGLNKANEVRGSFRNSERNQNKTNQDIHTPYRRGDVTRSSMSNDTFARGNSVRNSYRSPNTQATNARSSFRDTKPVSGASLKRTDSRKGTRNSTKTPSASSTPTISRENSKSSITVPVKPTNQDVIYSSEKDENLSSQEKDLIRIAKAFQKASNQIDKPNDNIENFMITVATEDVEEAVNERLKLDDLYEHIRHRMILAKDSIFEGCRTDITVDMSRYFDLLFKTLSTNFDRIGCEMVRNKITREKVCFLVHVKLVDYVDDLREIAAANVDLDEIDDDAEATYV